MDFRNSRCDTFLFDTGAGFSIIGEAIARYNRIQVIKLKTPWKIVEGSGNECDINGSCEISCKIPIINSIKRLQCLVLRGNHVDREILVSCQTLKNWDLIHPTFGRETITNYMNRCKSNSTRHKMTNKVNYLKVTTKLVVC